MSWNSWRKSFFLNPFRRYIRSHLWWLSGISCGKLVQLDLVYRVFIIHIMMNFFTLLIELLSNLISSIQITCGHILEQLLISLHEVRFMPIAQPSLITNGWHQFLLLPSRVFSYWPDINFGRGIMLIFLFALIVNLLSRLVVNADLSPSNILFVRCYILILILLYLICQWFTALCLGPTTIYCTTLTLASSSKLLQHIIPARLIESFVSYPWLLRELFITLSPQMFLINTLFFLISFHNFDLRQLKHPFIFRV